MNRLLLREQLIQFLNEDIGRGDRSTAALQGQKAAAVITAGEAGCFYGETIVRETALLLGWTVEHVLADGTGMDAGAAAARISGTAADLLAGERVLLNLLQRLSGTATMTSRAVQQVEGMGVRITDTRKTTPGLRMLEKDAVRAGGGVSHRGGLDDVCMIKENHIAAAGSITRAVELIRETAGPLTAIEIEVETESELREAVSCRPDVIMLDDCSHEEARRWIPIIPDGIRIERSGSITMETLRDAALPGIDFISIGALTHSAPALDLSMRITMKEAVR
ncbi:carboxylating nicotinate-nucleotide diphosphorylase [Alkalicoccus chagannorensis]|uniref:carboxylating nicotinate-nucleotide diphosphorylase n=1 Tax=Alkalicoccus chagannorensis TaxID=427072 RepID=UPI0003FB6D07|nr:carboxylating nicotinate-nucleotide diphosphorylase [Alkalicoccus chagannorensis]